MRRKSVYLIVATLVLMFGSIKPCLAGPTPTLDASLFFKVMVSTYNSNLGLIRAVAGTMTVLADGATFAEAALDTNGYLEFSIPTASASTWTLQVGNLSARHFSARIVNGFLQVMDTDNNCEIWYSENGDGSYAFEYYRQTLYVCNQAQPYAPILGRLSSYTVVNQAASDWTVTILDGPPGKGEYCSLALDADNKPHIAYYDSSNSALKYYNGATGSVSTLDNAATVGQHLSLALDSNGKPHVSYFDNTNKVLKYYNGATGTASVADNNATVGLYSSIALDSNGKPHISYYDYTNNNLKYYNGATGTASTVDSSASVGLYTSIALDSNDKPHISYYDSTNGALKYYNGATGTSSTLDTGSTGYDTSIALDSDGKPHISYRSQATMNCRYYDGATGTTTDVNSAGMVSSRTSIALGSDGSVHIAYQDISAGGSLNYAFKPGPETPSSEVPNFFGGGGDLGLGVTCAGTSAQMGSAISGGTGCGLCRALPFSNGADQPDGNMLVVKASGKPGLTLEWTYPDGTSQAWALPLDGTGDLSMGSTATVTTKLNNGTPFIQVDLNLSAEFDASLASGTHTLTYWLWDQAGNKSNYRQEFITID